METETTKVIGYLLVTVGMRGAQKRTRELASSGSQACTLDYAV